MGQELTTLSTAWVWGGVNFNRVGHIATTKTRRTKRQKGGQEKGGVEVYQRELKKAV